MLKLSPKYGQDNRPPYDGQEPDLSLLDIFHFFWRYMFLIIGAVAAACALALIYLMLATPIFTARTQVLIDPRVPQTFREQQSESLLAFDTPEVESQLALLRSDRISGKVVTLLSLADDPEFAPRADWSWRGIAGYVLSALWPFGGAGGDGQASGEDNSERRSIMDAVASQMGASRLGISHVIEISYNSPSRDNAARIANGIAEAYIEDQLETRAEAARQGSIWLEQRIDYLRRQMNAAALRAKEFKARRDYRIPNTAGQADPAELPAKSADGAGDENITLEELETQALTYRKIYESYLQAYADSVQRQSYPVTNARIITPATRPRRKSSPRGMRVLAAAIVIGGLFGVGLALLAHSASSVMRRIRNPVLREE